MSSAPAPRTIAELPEGRGVAVVGAHESVGFPELHARAHQLAHAVLERTDGAAPGAVGLLMGHDAPAVVAALGVLKAGGELVALPADGPLERAARVLADCGARLLVTDAVHADVARELALRTGLTVIDVAATGGQPTTAPPVRPAPGDPAVTLYTSGSTGTPKGVWLDHATMAASSAALGLALPVGPGDRISLLHSFSAVGGVAKLWTALLRGATLVPIDPRGLSRTRLLDRIRDTGVTSLHVVPTLFRRLAGEPVGDALDRLRYVRLGGEAVTRGDWELWRARCPPGSRLYVSYGSTETPLVVQDFYDHATPPPVSVVLPLGWPLPGVDVALLDGEGRPVAPGAVGRIEVTGTALFGGYRGQPEATAAVRRDEPDGRVSFRSGDLAHLGADGRLHFHGRADQQLKISGHRIEPAEVEDALRALPWVRDAAVVGRPGDGETMGLAAFVAGAAPDAHGPRALRAHLRAHLPRVMIPASVEALEALPLLDDGKVDRAALLRRPPPAAPPRVGPRNQVEETLVELVARHLETAAPGIHDDLFLDLAADSLSAVAVLDEVAELFATVLPLDVLARAPSVAELAEHLLAGGWAPPADGMLSLRPDAPQPPLFAICGVFGHALRLLLVGQALAPDRPFHALQPPGMDWTTVGRTTIEAMAAWYADAIRARQPRGPYHLLGTSFGGLMSFAVAAVLEGAGERVALLVLVDPAPPDVLHDGRLDRAPRRDFAAGLDLRDGLEAMGARVARQHSAATAQFCLRDPVAADITYLRCAQSPAGRDRRPLWAHVTTGRFSVVPVPGWHGTFHREPQFSAVTDVLRGLLAD